MKTLKRTLCLVLVLCMVVGVLAVSASAKFTDDDKITYTEAVGVMSGLGIIDGITASDGTVAFKPTSPVTRAQMAKLIYAGITGDVKGANVSVYASSTAFKDVKTTDWYAGYVNYVAQKGIIVGDGKGYFRPNDNVTGYEALVMILRALGYDSAAGGKEITTATNWKTAAADRAQELGMLKNVVSADSNFANNASRELACELIYRGFLNTKVTYNKLYESYIATGLLTDKGSTIFGTNFNYTGKSAVEQVASVSSSGTKITATTANYSFVTDDGYNAIGNVYKLFYKNDGTVVYAQKLSYSVDVSAYTSAKWTTLAQTVATTADVKTSTNYGDLSTTTIVASAAMTSPNSYQSLIVLPAAYTTAYGSASTKDLPVAAIANTYSRCTVKVQYQAATSTQTAAVSATITSIGGSSANTLIYDSRAGVDIDANNIDWASMVTNASRTKTVYYNEVSLSGNYYLTAIPTVTGTVSIKGTDNITLGGTKYTLALSDKNIASDGVKSNSTTTADVISALDFTSTYTAYLDASGKIFHIVGNTSSVTAIGDLVYVTALTALNTSNSGVFASDKTCDAYAQVVTAAGTVGAYKIVKVNGQTVVNAVPAGAVSSNYLVIAGDMSDYTTKLAACKGVVYGKISGSTIEIYTLDAAKLVSASYEVTPVNGTISASGTTFNTATVADAGAAYIDSTSAFVYIANAGSSTASATLKTGKHTSDSLSANYTYVTKTSQGVSVVTDCFVLSGYTGSTTTADLYYVTAYNGQTAAGYNYSVYKIGSSTPETVSVTAQVSTGTDTLYTLATSTSGKTLVASNSALTPVTGQATGSFTVSGTTYLHVGSKDIIVAGNVAFVNLVTNGVISSLADISSTAKADIKYWTVTTNGVASIVAVFVTAETITNE